MAGRKAPALGRKGCSPGRRESHEYRSAECETRGEESSRSGTREPQIKSRYTRGRKQPSGSVDELTSSHLQEAEKAKAVIADLEAELQAERMRLRKMSTEQDRLQREIGEVARELQRTETVNMIMNMFRFID